MRIIGISLVKNEERFIGTVLRNALNLCDGILVLDNGSTDRTVEAVSHVWRENIGRIWREPASDLTQTHNFIQQYVGKDVWLFGVDGDEIYDPAGLAALRQRIISNEFADSWMLRAHFLHVAHLNNGTARGWMAPPSRDPSKLYNMQLVESWPATPGRPLFLGVDTLRLFDGGGYFDRQRALNEEATWDESCFRCLHMRFMPRSRMDERVDRLAEPRLNPDDVTFLARKRQGRNDRRIYRRGELVTVPTAPFRLGENT